MASSKGSASCAGLLASPRGVAPVRAAALLWQAFVGANADSELHKQAAKCLVFLSPLLPASAPEVRSLTHSGA